jgi:hypothetical protein
MVSKQYTCLKIIFKMALEVKMALEARKIFSYNCAMNRTCVYNNEPNMRIFIKILV